MHFDALTGYIKSYNWDYFFTITTKRPRRDEIAFVRDIRNFFTNENVFEAAGIKRSFVALEPFRFRRDLHAHGLIAGDFKWEPALSLPWDIQTSLEKKFGRSRVELCRSQDDVSGYCAKYVTKWGTGDNYDFLGNWKKA